MMGRPSKLDRIELEDLFAFERSVGELFGVKVDTRGARMLVGDSYTPCIEFDYAQVHFAYWFEWNDVAMIYLVNNPTGEAGHDCFMGGASFGKVYNGDDRLFCIPHGADMSLVPESGSWSAVHDFKTGVLMRAET
jgi:hypothetical protein